MGTEHWLQMAARHRAVLTLAALLSTFAGADLLLNRPKGSDLQWLPVPFLTIGAALFAWAAWPKGVAPEVPRPSLAYRLLDAVTWRGRLVPYFPIFGIGLIFADLAYNLEVSATPALLTEDTIVLLGASFLICFGIVPPRFARERDFVLMFVVLLNAILVVPLLLARAVYVDFDRSVDVYSWVALAPQTSAVLNVLGVSNTLHPVYGSTAPGLTFTPKNLAVPVTVVITTACSGIYSFGIFASAFIAFVLTEYEQLSRRIWVLMGVGFLSSYMANVLRMVAIVLVGYFTDTPETDLQNMLIAHSYAGWVIFLSWIAILWGGTFRFLGSTSTASLAPVLEKRRKPACAICNGPLTPVVPSIRCGCGAVHHVICIIDKSACPSCGAPLAKDQKSPTVT